MAGKAYACDDRCQADRQFNAGQKAMKERRQAEAIKHYVQALLFYPVHTEAKASLRSLSLSYDDDFLKHRMKLYRIQELLDYIAFVKQQIASTSGEKVALKETFDIDAGPDKGGLDGIIAHLALTKKTLVDRYLAMQSQPERDAGKRVRKADPALKSESTKNLKTLMLQVDRLRAEVNDLRENAAVSEKRISDLTGQIADKSMDLYEKNSLLTEQKEGYRDLQDSLREARERLNLVQRIMQEKDEKIQVLGRDVKTLQAFAEQYHAINEETVQSLRQEFAGLQRELLAEIKISRQKIEAMEDALGSQNKNMTLLKIAVRAKGKKIVDMNQALVEKNQKIKKREEIIGYQVERMVEADGIVQIYRDKLREANDLLKEKIRRIRQLEKQSAEKVNYNE